LAKRARKTDQPATEVLQVASADLPEGWVLTRLGDVVQPSKEKVDPQRVPDLPYLSLEHIEAHSRRVVGHAAAREATGTKAVFHSGDVLYGKLRPYLNKVCRPSFDGVCSTDILVFSQRPELDSRYLLYFLNRQEVVDMTTHAMAGVNLPRINFKTLTDLDFPLPPLAEQKRIADRLDALLRTAGIVRDRLTKLVEDRKEGEREILSILKRFRQAILGAACSGQLTEAWRTAHPEVASGRDILRAICEDRGVSPEAITSGNDNGEGCPETWATTTLGFLAEPLLRGRPFITSGSRGWANRISQSGPFFIRSENINTEYLRLSDAVHVTPPPGAEADRTRVRANDLLLTITGNNVGRTAVVPPDCPDAHVSQHVAIIRSSRRCYTPFLWLWLRSDQHGQAQLRSEFYGQTKPGLSLEQVKSVWICLPPVEEQHEIVHRVEVLFKLVDDIETRVRTTTIRTESLTRAIFSKAFSGELVATEAELARVEGRDFESGEQLLQRVRQTPPPRRPKVIRIDIEDTLTLTHEVHMRRIHELSATHLHDILKKAKAGLSPEKLYVKSGIKEVDDFYTQLKREVEAGKVREQRKDKKTIILEAVR